MAATMLFGAAHGIRTDPAGLTLVVVFLVSLSLSGHGTAGAAWVGIVLGWAILLRPAAVFFLLPSIPFVHNPEPAGASRRRRWVAFLAPLVLLAALRLPFGGSLPAAPPAFDRASGPALPAIEAVFLRPDPPETVPDRSGGYLRTGVRTLLRALLLGLAIGPFFAGPQKALAVAGRRLLRGALLFLIGLAVTGTALLLAGSGSAALPAWGLPALVVLLALAYHRSHPSDRPAGHGAIVAVFAGTALLLAGFNYF